MKKEIIQTGVVAELDGEYWGIQYQDGQCTSYDFGPIENACIANPEFCKKPEDMTWQTSWRLRIAKLVPIKKIIIYDVQL